MINPGPDMDTVIAQRLWRANVQTDDEGNLVAVMDQGVHHVRVPVPKFSTDLESANKVIEMFESKGWLFRHRVVSAEGQPDTILASFYRDDNRNYRFNQAPNLPQAICEAAISALNGTNLA